MDRTKEEYINGYCERSGISREFYDNNMVALPCRCEFQELIHWNSTANDPIAIKAHMDLYWPEGYGD